MREHTFVPLLDEIHQPINNVNNMNINEHCTATVVYTRNSLLASNDREI